MMELDPIEVLNHLKALGYEHVEPHLLEKFMKDLKKLIKYERKNEFTKTKQKTQIDEKVHVNLDSNSQCRYVLKERKDIFQNNRCKNIGIKTNNNVFERLSRPNSKTKLCSKAVSTVGVQTDLQYLHTKNNKVSSVLRRKHMDPVSLHQYYQTEWQNHKVPGEKNHDQLRWKIRQMMIDK